MNEFLYVVRDESSRRSTWGVFNEPQNSRETINELHRRGLNYTVKRVSLNEDYRSSRNWKIFVSSEWEALLDPDPDTAR